MPVFREWTDFVIQLHRNGKPWTVEERLDTSQGLDVRSPLYGAGDKIIITERDIFEFRDYGLDDDELEAIEVGLGGYVLVWTKYKIWYVIEGERLRYIPRHPPKPSDWLPRAISALM